MRVIGGTARGRRLAAPDLPGLRPTSDRVREAIFDILASRGVLEGASVLDLFAGSGALGIEALSRGAGAVCSSRRTAGRLRPSAPTSTRPASPPHPESASSAPRSSSSSPVRPARATTSPSSTRRMCSTAGVSCSAFSKPISPSSSLRPPRGPRALNGPPRVPLRRYARHAGRSPGPDRDDPRSTEKDPV